jgi:alpha-tubulin suppressor-like RCC1 family protein
MKKLLSALLVILLLMSSITFSVSAETLDSVAWQNVTTGGNTTFAVTVDGTVYGWGSNSTGALGDGTTTDKILPAQATGTHHWSVLSTGGGHTVAIKDDGTLWAWGRNWYGELGDGTTDDKTSPVRIGTDSDWKSVSAGGDHTLAIKTNGDLYSWGSGFYGQLGLGIDGNTANRHTPQLVSSSQDWVYVYARGGNSFAIMSDGTLWGCGENFNYVLGLGDSNRRKSFTRIGTASDWSIISSQGSHTMGIKTNGELWGWGGNSYGQLGNGNNARQTTPVRIGSGSDWTEVSCGQDHTVVRKSDGSIWTMGWNSEGQLGSGDETDSNIPVRVGADNDWVSVKAGANHNVAVKANGTLWSWGRSDAYQLGLGTKTSRHYPVRVTGATLPIAKVSTNPANLATGVAADAAVSVTFEDWVQNGVNASQIRMNDSAGNRIDYTRTINGPTVTINRRGLLPNNTTYTVIFPDEGMQDVPAFSFSFSTGAAPFNFKRYAYHTVGYYPTQLTAGDFNKDSKKDVAVVNELDHNISIALGNGDGTFQSSVNIGYLMNSRPSGIEAADINGDGNEDLVVVRHLKNTMAVFAGNGDGTFQAPALYSTGTMPLMPATGDWDGDGDTDLAVVNRDSNNVSVYFNNGSGTFGSAVNYPSGSYPYWVTAADLNGDNLSDLITANYSSDNLSVLISQGNGTFDSAVNYLTGPDPSCVAVGDLNGDDVPDLFVIQNANYVGTLLGNGNGTFQAQTNHAIPPSASPITGTVADLNGDGKNDLVIAGEWNDTVIVRLGNGDGTFQEAVSFLAGSGPYMVLAEDFNDDSKPDLVTTGNSRIAILLNESTALPGSGIEADTTPPAWVNGSLTASNIGQTGLTLTWAGALDDTGITGYRLYKDGTLYDSLGDVLTANVSGLAPGTSYTFKVEGGDAGGNWSTNGPELTVTTLAAVQTSTGGDMPYIITAADVQGSSSITYQKYFALTGKLITIDNSALRKMDDLNRKVTVVTPAATVILVPALAKEVLTVDAGAKVVLSITSVPDRTVVFPTNMRRAGHVVEIIAKVSTSAGEQDLTGELELVLPYEQQFVQRVDRLGVYGIENGRFHYIGGIANTSAQTVKAKFSHFSRYCVLEDTRTFPDLEGHWSRADVESMLTRQIIFGNTDGSYAPDRPVTRAEFAALLARVAEFSGISLSDDLDVPFSDVPSTAWYKEAVTQMAQSGIINGYSDRTFRPQQVITREEMSAMLIRLMTLLGIELPAYTGSSLASYHDCEETGPWAKQSLAHSVSLGLLRGTGSGYLEPKGISTRAAAAAVLNRLLKLAQLI